MSAGQPYQWRSNGEPSELWHSILDPYLMDTGSHNQFTIGILYEAVCFANVVIRKAISEQGTSVAGQNIVIRTIVPQCSIQ